jgi:hypothetical protein
VNTCPPAYPPASSGLFLSALLLTLSFLAYPLRTDLCP